VNGKYEIHHGVGIGHGTITTLNPLVTMRQDLRQSTDVDLMTVRTDSQHPGDLYLRAVTLDRFDGVEWKADKREVRNFDSKLPDVTGLSPIVVTAPVDTQITVSNQFEADYLPMPYPPVKVNVDGQWRLDPLTSNIVSHNGRGQISGRRYTVDSLDVSPSPGDVAGIPPVDAYLQPYLQLPNLPPAVRQTAERITRGASGPLEIGSALQEWFRRPGNFVYDLTVRSGTGSPDIMSFLAVRRGYCEQFAATMAAMARLLGVPARVDVGFTSGRVADDGVSRIVSAHDAHAWPELWLPNVGWTRFEPTPGSASSNPAEPSWLAMQHPNPEQSNNPSGNETAPPQQAAAAPPAAGGGAGAQHAREGQFDCTFAAGAGTCSPNSPPNPNEAEHNRWQILWAALACLLFVVLTGPGLTRALIRRRRWAVAARPRSTGPDAAGAAEIAWRELRDGAVDLGHVWPTARTPRQCAGALAAEGALSNVGTAALHHVTTTVERTRYARRAAAGANADQLRTAVIRIHFELGRNAGRKWRIRAVVLPMSLRPLLPRGTKTPARSTRRTKPNPTAAPGWLLRRRPTSR
jgi:transglutaminase-like putative cysteine protease